MAIAVNRNTAGTPMTGAGRTGAQSIKFIPAPRVYVKTADASPLPPTVKSNGNTPAGWTDLGIVSGNVKLNYQQKVKEVTTGIDNYFRAAYIEQKSGGAEFALSQLDDVVLEQITGTSASIVQAGSIVAYQVGQLDLNQMALLMVVQSKLDGKEWQFYNPNAYLNFAFEDASGEFNLKTTAYLPFFTAPSQTLQGMLCCTMFA